MEDLTPQKDGSYLIRWTLFRWFGGRALYLHKIMQTDWAREPHDHPKKFTSIGLKGGYIEEIYKIKSFPNGENSLVLDEERVWDAPWVRTFPGTRIHRLRVIDSTRPTWTMVWVGKTEQQWGFFDKNGRKFSVEAAIQRYGWKS